MKYTHVVSSFYDALWAMYPPKIQEVISVLAYRAAGQAFTSEEIRARIGGASGAMAPARSGGGVAILPLRGVIAHRMGGMDESSGGTSTERFTTMFRQVVADPNIATIVFDCESPGGTVPGIQELAAEIFAARGRKRMIAVSNSMCCSAAYWLASQADEVISIPSGVIGSIGVFAAHQDLSKALEKEGVTITLMSAGRYKTEGNPFEELTAEGRRVMQGRIDNAYRQFVADVARGRGVTPAAVRNGFGEGRALQALDAKAAGLIDGVSTFDGVLSELVGRGGPTGLRASAMPALAATATTEREHRRRMRLLGLLDDDEETAETERVRRMRLLL